MARKVVQDIVEKALQSFRIPRWFWIGLVVVVVSLSVGFSVGSVLFVDKVVESAVRSVIANSSLDTYTFVNKYTPLLDKERIAYPEGVDILEEIFIWSRFFDVDPDTVLLLVYVESGLNSAATGKAGEIGLFQLMYSTALLHYPNTLVMPSELYDVHTNVICGIAHWKSCLDGAKGNYDLARRYYNGGSRYAFISQVTAYVNMHHGGAKKIRRILIDG